MLITFQGPHDYVSPSWYGKEGVPTWNYQAVHVYGVAKVITDSEALKQIVNELTHKYESGFDKPWKPEYKNIMLKAIVGLEIEIKEIQAKYKLSQNKSEGDRERVISQVNSELAGVMKNNES